MQTLILNKISFGLYDPYIHAFLHVMFIMLLPFEMNKGLILGVSFIFGLSIDAFQDTFGLYSAACVMTAFARQGVLKLLSSTDEYEFRNVPIVQVMGFGWYFMYAFILLVIHNLWFFLLEDFRLTEIPEVLLKTVIGACVSVVFVLVAQYLIFSRDKENG